LAGAVALLRAVSFFVAHRLGSRVGRESPEITTWGWLGYLPQAGVTLGLLALASERLPEIAPYFQSLGMGLVAINLLLGPLALRIALVKSSEEDTFDVPRPQDLIKAGTTSEPLEYADIDFPQLQKKMKAATLSFIESQERDFAERNQKGKSSFLHFLEILPEESIVPNETYRSSLEKINVQLLAYSEDFIKTIELVDPTLSSIEENVSVPYTRENWTQMPGDSWTVRLRKLRIRILNTFRGGEQRTIPLKTVYKIHFNTYAAKSGRHQLNLWFNSGLASYDELRKFLEGTQTRSETQVRIEEIWNLSNTTLVAESTASMADTARAISNDVRKIDTAYLRAKDYLFSETEPRLRKYLTETNEKRQVWANKLPALIDSVLIHSILFHLKISIQNTLDEQCIIPLEDLRKDIVQIFDKIDHLIDSDYGPNQARELVKLMAAMNVQIRDQYVFLSSMRMLSRHFSDSLGKYFHLDRRYELLPIEVFGMRITEPGEMRTVKVQFASNINRTFFSTFFPPIESLIDQVSEGLDIFQEDIEEIQKTLLFIAESSAKQDSVYIPLSDAEAKNLYSNVKIKISEAMARVLQSLEGVRERIRHEIDGAFVEIRSIVQSPNVIRSASTHWYSFIVRTESKLREHLSFFYKFGKRLRKIIKGFLKTFEESPSVLELRKRMKAGSLDAQVINEYLKEVLSAPQKLERLPQIYRRLFTLDSLRDNRLFSVHSEAFHHLPLPGSESSIHRVLIVGKSGMGKSSLLNLAELASLNSRVIRLDRNYGTTHLSIISLLARQLNVNQSTKSICMALKQSPATVIIDNLDHWWAPQSHEDMTQLIEIISMSSIDIRWIVSIDFFNYRLLNQAYSMRSLFHRVEFLEPLGHEALEKLILHRNSLSGLEPEFSRGFGTQIFDHLWRSGPQDIYFELLRSASGGNLRSALQIWIQSVGRIDNRTVRLHSHPVVSPDLTFLEQFNYESLLILKELYRFGPRSIRQLIEETHIRDTFLAREVESLRQTGLVTNKSKDGHIIQIDVLAKYYIGEQLHHLQII
jgi:hypothetical protein